MTLDASRRQYMPRAYLGEHFAYAHSTLFRRFLDMDAVHKFEATYTRGVEHICSFLYIYMLICGVYHACVAPYGACATSPYIHTHTQQPTIISIPAPTYTPHSAHIQPHPTLYFGAFSP